MAPLADEVTRALAPFKPIAERGSVVDVYLTTSKYRGEPASRVSLDALKPTAFTFIGGQNPADLLRQFEQLRGGDAYDVIFVLTDGTGYALGANDAKPEKPQAPLWFVHLGGKYPLGYDDATLEAIQASGGGISGTLDDALTRFTFSFSLAHADSPASSGEIRGDWVDGYFWSVTPTSALTPGQGAAVQVDPNFAPLAARWLILTHIRRERAALAQLNTLDQLHALAGQYGIVTPYSSMIVLVNQAQQRVLDDLEKQTDRFQREMEEVGQTQQPFDVTAVPEPHEYLLMALGAAFVLWYARRTRRRVPFA
jgi:putative PEP-CTERM system integral membrane protein